MSTNLSAPPALTLATRLSLNCNSHHFFQLLATATATATDVRSHQSVPMNSLAIVLPPARPRIPAYVPNIKGMSSKVYINVGVVVSAHYNAQRALRQSEQWLVISLCSVTVSTYVYCISDFTFTSFLDHYLHSEEIHIVDINIVSFPRVLL